MDKDADYIAFVESRSPRLFRTAFALTGNYAEAEDLVQTALIKVYVGWHRVRQAEAPDAYVRRILVNQATSWWRRRSHRAETATADPPDRATEGHEQAMAESDAMWSALLRLPPRQRAVVVLRYYEDLSEQDIAATLGIAPGTVKSQASAALRSLRATVGDPQQIAQEGPR